MKQKVTTVERERRRDVKYGVSADLLVGTNFLFNMAVGIFTLEPKPRSLQAIRHIEAEGPLVSEHKTMPSEGRATIIPDANILDVRPPNELPVAGSYQLQTRMAHFTIYVLPADFAILGAAVGRARLELHMVIDPPASRRDRGRVRYASFTIEPCGDAAVQRDNISE